MSSVVTESKQGPITRNKEELQIIGNPLNAQLQFLVIVIVVVLHNPAEHIPGVIHIQCQKQIIMINVFIEI